MTNGTNGASEHATGSSLRSGKLKLRRRRWVGPGVYLVTVAALVAITIVGLEAYCRWSPRFTAFHQLFVKQAVLANARNAVFGDSHVGQISYLKGFDFLGQAGQKPAEFLTLVRFL